MKYLNVIEKVFSQVDNLPQGTKYRCVNVRIRLDLGLVVLHEEAAAAADIQFAV